MTAAISNKNTEPTPILNQGLNLEYSVVEGDYIEILGGKLLGTVRIHRDLLPLNIDSSIPGMIILSRSNETLDIKKE